MKAPATNQRKEHNVKILSVGITTLSLQLCRLAVVASQICEIPRNSPKIRTYNSSRSSKVIYLGINQNLIFNFLLVSNSNYGRDIAEKNITSLV